MKICLTALPTWSAASNGRPTTGPQKLNSRSCVRRLGSSPERSVYKSSRFFHESQRGQINYDQDVKQTKQLNPNPTIHGIEAQWLTPKVYLSPDIKIFGKSLYNYLEEIIRTLGPKKENIIRHSGGARTIEEYRIVAAYIGAKEIIDNYQTKFEVYANLARVLAISQFSALIQISDAALWLSDVRNNVNLVEDRHSKSPRSQTMITTYTVGRPYLWGNLLRPEPKKYLRRCYEAAGHRVDQRFEDSINQSLQAAWPLVNCLIPPIDHYGECDKKLEETYEGAALPRDLVGFWKSNRRTWLGEETNFNDSRDCVFYNGTGLRRTYKLSARLLTPLGVRTLGKLNGSEIVRPDQLAILIERESDWWFELLKRLSNDFNYIMSLGRDS